MRKKLMLWAVIGVAILFIPVFAHAFDWDRQQYEFGVKLGPTMGGEVFLDPPDKTFDLESGNVFFLSADSIITPKMSIGGFFRRAEVSNKVSDNESTIDTIGAALKLRFTPDPKLQLRPGLRLGYDYKFGNGDDKMTAMNIGAFVELAYHLNDGFIITGEVGAVTGSGGNSDFDMDYSFPYIVIGVAFGK
jgi:hypothetical protein